VWTELYIIVLTRTRLFLVRQWTSYINNCQDCRWNLVMDNHYELAGKVRPRGAFTLIRVQVRVSLHVLARVELYCKQCYVTWTLHYICHDNDVIIDVKTFWCPFLLFSWRKSAQKLLIFQGNFYLYKTCIIVNGCYWSICKLVFTLTLWRPLLPYVYRYLQHPVDRVKPSFVIFDIRALWRSALSVRVAGCQKLQMTAYPSLAQDAL